MKRSGSEWDLEEFLRPVVGGDGSERSHSPAELEQLLIGFMGDRDGGIDNNQSGGQLTGSQMWSQSHSLHASRHSSISANMESQSSLCTGGSPTSSLKPNKGAENHAPGGTSGSEQSDDESIEIDAASGDQSAVPDIKRMRRMVSNRESARRSRKRKQAHLADLELQVDHLRGENASLYKQLTDANHEFTEAVTDNRVLKSDVETLRVKVKMAEDLVTRGSLTCSLDHLLQSQIGASNNMLNSRNLCRVSEVPSIIDLPANDGCFISASAAGQAQNIGNETKDGNMRMRLNQSSSLQIPSTLQSGLPSEITSCGSDIWSWDSPADVMSKQF